VRGWFGSFRGERLQANVNETFARQIEHLRKPFGNVVVAGLVAMLLMMMMLFL
jgi:hypothetical protein